MRPGNLADQHLLIEYVFGLLDAGQRTAFDARIAQDAELSRRVAALRRTLAPLDTLRPPEPSPGLFDRILHGVERTTPLEYVAASTTIAPEATAPPARRSVVSLREVLAAAACIGLLASVFLPGVSRMRSARLQAMCGSNLASLGQGLSHYAMAHDGMLPRVTGPTNVNWLANPNRRHVTPVIRWKFIVPKNMICPSAPGAKLSEEQIRNNLEEFLKRMDLRFYSTQNLDGQVPRWSTRVVMPLAADANPMFENGRFDPDPTDRANSRAHGGRGQNVLLMDGSTSFLRTPMFGKQEDNIWRLEHVQNYQGTETQQSATDAFIIP